MSLFSKSKGEYDKKGVNGAGGEVGSDARTASEKSSREIVSTLGQGILIKGNIVCEDTVQIYGRVIGNMIAARLVICEGAQVEGEAIVEEEAIIHGAFKGIIRCNSVKLQDTAVVEGEIYSNLFSIEQNALFEGVSRRLDKPGNPLSNAKIKSEIPLSPSMTDAAPASGVVG